MLISQFISIVLYLLCLLLMKDVINVSTINAAFCVKIVILVAISWLPLHLAKKIIQKYDPSETDKIMDKINH